MRRPFLPVICVFALAGLGAAGEPGGSDTSAGEYPRLAKILERNSPVLRDVYTNVATPYKIKGRSPVGYYLGNGDATVTARDAKGKWTFIVSPLAYYHGDTSKDVSKDNPTAAGWAGQIDIAIPELAACRDYEMTMDLWRGELRGRFAGDAGAVTMRTHVVRDTNCLVTAIENAGPGAVTVSVELLHGQAVHRAIQVGWRASGPVAYVMRSGRHVDNPASVVCYTGLGSRIVGAESTAKSDQPQRAGLSAVSVKPGSTVYVVSSYEVSAVFPENYLMPAIQAMVANQTEDPVTPVLKRLKDQTPATAAAMIDSNAGWWRDFWRRSHIDIPTEPLVEKQWYGRLYLAGCMCREGASRRGYMPGSTTRSPPGAATITGTSTRPSSSTAYRRPTIRNWSSRTATWSSRSFRYPGRMHRNWASKAFISAPPPRRTGRCTRPISACGTTRPTRQ